MSASATMFDLDGTRGRRHPSAPTTTLAPTVVELARPLAWLPQVALELEPDDGVRQRRAHLVAGAPAMAQPPLGEHDERGLVEARAGVVEDRPHDTGTEPRCRTV